jgi:N-acetylneuraminic acid mutarotase
MKKQLNPNIKAHLIRSAFYVLLLLAVCLIPFALGQRNSNNRGGHAALAPSAPTKNVAPVASDYPKAPAAPSSRRFSPEMQHLATKLPPGWPMVTGQTGTRAIRVPLKPTRPAGSCTWSIVANYPETLESPAVCSDGTVAYSAGGFIGSTGFPTAGFYSYDPVADSWSALAPLPQQLYDARSTYAANVNKVYVFGGIDANNNVLNTTYIYDIATDSWTTGAAMPDARFFPAVAYYDANGKIYVIGGIDSFFNEASQTWEYDPITDTWDTSRTSIPVAMGGSATSIVGQNIYLQGSFGDVGATNLNYRYDIVADLWTQMAPLPFPRFEAAGAAIGTKTYVVGGGNPALSPQASAQDRKQASIRAPATSFNKTFIYDTTTDTWFTGPNTNVRHSFTGGTAIGDLMLVVCGFDGVSGDTNTVEKGELLACTPTPTPTCTPPPPTLSGLVVGDGLTVGFAPNGYQQIASNIANYTFCKSVSAPNDFAIFQTHNPWGSTVVADAIACAGHHYQVFTPDELAGFDFSQYRVVILNWDDTFLSEFDTQYEAAIPALEAYAAAGGVVWVQGAIQGDVGEDCYALPFGGQSCVDFGDSDPIVDPSNPMVQGVPSPITGNFASHVADTCLPVEADVVVVNGVDNNTVLYELGPGAPCTTPTPPPPRCDTGLIHNGGFESGNFTGWTIDGTIPSPEVLNVVPYSGRFSALVGGNPPSLQFCDFGTEPDGDSSFYQQFGPVPANAELSFWHWDCTTDIVTFDQQAVYITDTDGNILQTIFLQASNAECWVNETVDLTPWVGQTIGVKFLVHQDGFGDLTSMFVDEVQVTLPGPCASPTPRPTPTPRPQPTRHPRP